MVPAKQLVGSVGILSDVEILKQSGTGEPAGTEVEGKVHERIKLALAERNLDQPLDRLLRFANVPQQNDFRLRLGNSPGITLGVD